MFKRIAILGRCDTCTARRLTRSLIEHSQHSQEWKKVQAKVVLFLSHNEAPIDEIADTGIPVVKVHVMQYSTREDHERVVIEHIDDHRVDLIVLAGFLRILSAEFVHKYENRIINTHPALLPDYKGLSARKRAYEAGEKVSGITIHIVSPELDAGPIIGQTKVSIEVPREGGVPRRSTFSQFEAHMREAEIELYNKVLTDVVTGSIELPIC